MIRDPIEVGTHLKFLRQHLKIKQEQVAERSGLSVDSIGRLERGTFSPSLSTINKLCLGYGLRLSAFFEINEVRERGDEQRMEELLAQWDAGEVAPIPQKGPAD